MYSHWRIKILWILGLAIFATAPMSLAQRPKSGAFTPFEDLYRQHRTRNASSTQGSSSQETGSPSVIPVVHQETEQGKTKPKSQPCRPRRQRSRSTKQNSSMTRPELFIS